MKLTRDWVLLSVLLLGWGLNYPLVKIGLEYSTPLAFSFYRVLLAFVALFLITLPSMRSKKSYQKFSQSQNNRRNSSFGRHLNRILFWLVVHRRNACRSSHNIRNNLHVSTVHGIVWQTFFLRQAYPLEDNRHHHRFHRHILCRYKWKYFEPVGESARICSSVGGSNFIRFEFRHIQKMVVRFRPGST